MPFRGRDAVLSQYGSGVSKKLAGFKVEQSEAVLLGRETIYRNGERVGWLSNGGYGHHLGCFIGYGYIRKSDGIDDDYIRSGTYQLDVATERVDCKVFLEPLYDPYSKRVKA